jgi:hypothetical protein
MTVERYYAVHVTPGKIIKQTSVPTQEFDDAIALFALSLMLGLW